MATITPNRPLTDPPPGDELRVEQVAGEGRREALGTLLTGRSDGREPAVERFLEFAREQRLDLSGLWAAYRGRRMAGACLVVPSAGRTAMMFVSPARRLERDPVVMALARAATAKQDPRRVRLIQCLLEPEQAAEGDALQATGFTRLATLLYMSRPIAGAEAVPLELDAGLIASPYSAANRSLFADAILASYQDTHDCPGLLGLREIDDILDGHMSTGVFDPKLWFAVHRAGEPAGVMLLSELSHQDAGELVYLGLAPAFRGRGLARRLLRHGVSVIAARRVSRILLAVDRDNTPAVSLYRSLRFTVSSRKTALIFPLK